MLENNTLVRFIVHHRIKLSIIGTYIALIIGLLWIPQLDRYISKNDQALNILIFPEVVSAEVLREFSKKTGITIYAKHVESDAEMCACLSDSHSAYDAVCIPEYLIPEFKRLGYIQPINIDHLSNYHHLHKLFRSEAHTHDSIPFSWALFGLGIDTKTYPNLEHPSWNILFEKLSHKICVSDDPRSLIIMGALALNFPTETLSKSQLFAIIALLKKQKPHVEIYTDTNIALLFANEIVPLAYTSYNALALASKYNQHARFVVPQEGAIRISQNWIIPRKSLKAEMAHTFINFMLAPESARINEELTEFLPTNQAHLDHYWTEEEQQTSTCPLPPEHIIRAAHRAPYNVSARLLSSFWITLKNT